MKECINSECKAINPDDAKFCFCCGKKFPEQKTCSKCGKDIAQYGEVVKYCPYCGECTSNQQMTLRQIDHNVGILRNSTIASRVKAIIVDKLCVDENHVTESAVFTTELGADSLDAVELIMEFEKEFGITIPDEKAESFSSVGDAIDYIESVVDYSTFVESTSMCKIKQ